MSTQSNPNATGTYVFSDDAMEEMENLESTEVMELLAELPVDYDATVVMDDGKRSNPSKQED